jgi:acetyltransferase-like isoleucine patch superfamily enzyme
MDNMKPIVSVLMITYNHEKYIAQAIDSVLMQKSNFDYEIVIGEDCSTDRTRGIILEYKAKYTDKIKLLLKEKNVGMMQNFIDTPKVCITGNVSVGDFTTIGTGAIIIPNIKIGNNCIIGAGSVVTSDIPDNCFAVGVPAKVIKAIQPFND